MQSAVVYRVTVEPAAADPRISGVLSFAGEAGSLDFASVRSDLDAAREVILRRWQELPGVDDVAVEWFAGETYEHYEEHLPDLWSASGA